MNPDPFLRVESDDLHRTNVQVKEDFILISPSADGTEVNFFM